MESKYTNKNGVKLLAAIMAFAMILVAGSVVIDQDGSDAAISMATGVETLDGTQIETAGSYYIASNRDITIADSIVVSLYVLDGKAVKVDINSSATVSVYAVSGGPDADKKIVAEDIADVTASFDGDAEFRVAASSGENGSNGTGSIRFTSGNARSTNCAIELISNTVKEFYSESETSIPIEYRSGFTGEATVKFNIGHLGINAVVKNGENRFDLKGASLATTLTATLGDDDSISLESGSNTTNVLTTGLLEIVEGSVEVDTTTLKLSNATFAGVTKTILSGGIPENAELMSKLDVGTDNELAGDAFVYNTHIDNDEVKIAGGKKICFIEGSTFSGEIIGLADSNGQSITITVQGGNSGRSIEVSNTTGALTVKGTNTAVLAGTDVVGSDLVVKKMSKGVTFTDGTQNAVVFADGLEIETENAGLSMGEWDVIIPKDSTIELKGVVESPAKLTFTNGCLYRGFRKWLK